MAKSKQEIVNKKFSDLEKALHEQFQFERYEFMERPEIAQFAKGRATAFQYALAMVQRVHTELNEGWKK